MFFRSLKFLFSLQEEHKMTQVHFSRSIWRQQELFPESKYLHHRRGRQGKKWLEIRFADLFNRFNAAPPHAYPNGRRHDKVSTIRQRTSLEILSRSATFKCVPSFTCRTNPLAHRLLLPSCSIHGSSLPLQVRDSSVMISEANHHIFHHCFFTIFRKGQEKDHTNVSVYQVLFEHHIAVRNRKTHFTPEGATQCSLYPSTATPKQEDSLTYTLYTDTDIFM